MCYYLYGNTEERAFNEIKKINQKYDLISYETKTSIPFFSSIKDGVYFRITDDECDCVNPIIKKDNSHKEITKYKNWLHELGKYDKLKYLYIIKYWDDNSEKTITEITKIHINDVDENYLVNMKDDTLYKIMYYKIYSC